MPLDPSFKQYEYKSGVDLYSALTPDGANYYWGYIQNTADITPYQYYSKRLLDYIDNEHPEWDNATVMGADALEDTKTIINHEFPYFMGTLPYRMKVVGARYQELPASMRYEVALDIERAIDGTGIMSHRLSLAQVAGHRVTVGYEPAESEDALLAGAYGAMLNVPAYLMAVRPVLKVDGEEVARGEAVGLGEELDFSMTFSGSNRGSETVQNVARAGEFSALVLMPTWRATAVVSKAMEGLESEVDLYEIDEEILGRHMHALGMSYFERTGYEEEVYAKNLRLGVFRLPSCAIVKRPLEVDSVYGVPLSADSGGLAIDVDRDVSFAKALDGGGKERGRDYQMVAGLGGSAWESGLLGAFYNAESISTTTLLKQAIAEGASVHDVGVENMESVMPALFIEEADKTEVRNAVNAGLRVVVPERELTAGDWSGIGYIVYDPTTGSAAYLVSGGLSGGLTVVRNGDKWAVSLDNRQLLVAYAVSFLDTPYVLGGENPECGFDCSGFVYYVFENAYGSWVFPTRPNVDGIAKRCDEKNWNVSESDKYLSDILRFNGHVGINTQAENMIHALGRQVPRGNEVCVAPDVPSSCNIPKDYKVCGKFRRVVETPISYGGPLSGVCRPVPDVGSTL